MTQFCKKTKLKTLGASQSVLQLSSQGTDQGGGGGHFKAILVYTKILYIYIYKIIY